MIISGSEYSVGDTWGPVPISDDFVDASNKTGKGSGAARFYIGREDDPQIRIHFGSKLFTATCVMLKENLLTLLDSLKDEYFNPTQVYNNSAELQDLWYSRRIQLEELPDVLRFNIQEQVSTENRCYVKGDHYFGLLREIPLPRRANVTLTKIIDQNGIASQLIELHPVTAPKKIRFWQVQHDATGSEAESLGVLWAPKKTKAGTSSKWYANMTKVEPGDRIYSYREGQIQAVGVVQVAAISAPSPFINRETEEHGWLVSADFIAMTNPFSPTDHYGELQGVLTEEDKLSVRSPGGTAIIGYLKEVSGPLAAEYERIGNLEDSLRCQITKPEDWKSVNIFEKLSSELLLPTTFLSEIHELLEDKKQVIFYGPPGAGKTYVALKLAEVLSGGSDEVSPVEVVQFHPSYAYEDFVEGFRPTEDGAFKLRRGKLLSIAERAIQNPDKKFFLIIDEINRGNVAKVFGEMYFLLEYRDRDIQLQYSDEPFRMPENLYFIGTMNSADRSIGLIDSALRRRFHFVSFYPTEDAMKNLLRDWLAKNAPAVSWIADLVDYANFRLDNPDFAIGPSHFMKKGLTEDLARKIWRRSIIPYVEDFFFSQKEKAAEYDLDRLRVLKRLDKDFNPADSNTDVDSEAS